MNDAFGVIRIELKEFILYLKNSFMHLFIADSTYSTTIF